MQGSTTWTPPSGTLGQILEATRRRLPSIEKAVAAVEPDAGLAAERPTLRDALRRESVAIIAEIKRRSPSKGVLNADLDAAQQAMRFERGGASAVSVLTEPSYFGGSNGDLTAVRSAVGVPVLKKDFHIAAPQLIEARTLGASAVLLIARALPHEELRSLIETAERLGVEAVVEVRTEQELHVALDAGARIVGVNSRDLETLAIDERVPRRLMPMIPRDVVGIWESGVHDVDAVRRAAKCGADAVLVGSALSRTSDPESLVRSLAGIARMARRG